SHVPPTNKGKAHLFEHASLLHLSHAARLLDARQRWPCQRAPVWRLLRWLPQNLPSYPWTTPATRAPQSLVGPDAHGARGPGDKTAWPLRDVPSVAGWSSSLAPGDFLIGSVYGLRLTTSAPQNRFSSAPPRRSLRAARPCGVPGVRHGG